MSEIRKVLPWFALFVGVLIAFKLSFALGFLVALVVCLLFAKLKFAFTKMEQLHAQEIKRRDGLALAWTERRQVMAKEIDSLRERCRLLNTEANDLHSRLQSVRSLAADGLKKNDDIPF